MNSFNGQGKASPYEVGNEIMFACRDYVFSNLASDLLNLASELQNFASELAKLLNKTHPKVRTIKI